MTVDLSTQKGVDADSKGIQEIELVPHLTNPKNAIVANELMFVLTTLEKNIEARSLFF